MFASHICSFFTIAGLSLLLISGCTHDKFDSLKPQTDYPEPVEAIVITKCATSGCHNDQSYTGAAGLNLSTWMKLFEGSRGGSVVVPYRPDYSTLCYYTNTDTLKGLALEPTMPYGQAPLSNQEYDIIKNWIADGAPDRNGFIKFSDYEDEPKLYVCNRGCDVISIVEPSTGLIMRCIDVGTSSEIEGPAMVKVSDDMLHWYVIFNQGTSVQKYRTSDNVKVGELNIGSGIWSAMVLSADSKKGFLADADYNGRILYIDIENMQVLETYQTGLKYPVSLCLNPSNNMLYATSKEGNYIYKIDVQDPLAPVIQQVSLETGVPASDISSLDPVNMIVSDDDSRYFVICLKSNELRIIQSSNDSLIGISTTGSNPAEIIYDVNTQHVFVSCLGVPGTAKKSMINVFDYSTGLPITDILAGHDSRGISIDISTNRLFVANRNVTDGGPAAHHAPLCTGRNGYMTAIDLSTLELIPGFKIELSVDPYHLEN